ncbi:MAG: hypothetical protein LBK82_00965 [Planctomycetaceae bacterium]|jgi:hypothetical protein|nr:hypothetical protein [Planctomycetaceae bacterium]
MIDFMGKIQKVGDVSLKHRVGVSRLAPNSSWQYKIAVVNLIHCRRVRRRNLSAKGCLPCVDYF